MASDSPNDLTRTSAAPGEPFVWITAMGLSIGLLMVVGLLGIIVANGLPVFWPNRVVEVTLKPGVANPVPNAGDTITGELVQTRTKRIPILGPDGTSIEDQKEVQFYIGNKDAYGINFVFANRADIASMQEPKDIYRIERLEYGIAFGYPRELVLANGSTIAAQSPEFSKSLAALVAETTARRHDIEQIEKRDIGAINTRLTDLRVSSDKNADAEIASLNARYDTLAAEARALRAEQSANTLVYATPTGVERRLPIGDIVSYSLPNQLGLLQQAGLFVHNIWNFLSEDPREANTEGGIFPAIFGTFVMTLLMSVAVVPFGVIAAIYLREYAKQGLFVRSVRIAVNNLAGVPSIVFGVFGLGFFVYFVGGTIDSLLFSDYLPTPTFGTGRHPLGGIHPRPHDRSSRHCGHRGGHGRRAARHARGLALLRRLKMANHPPYRPPRIASGHPHRSHPRHGSRRRRGRSPHARRSGQTRPEPPGGLRVSVFPLRAQIHAPRLPYLRPRLPIAGLRSRKTNGLCNHSSAYSSRCRPESCRYPHS